ncbi:MAG: hypothetical protein KUL83_09835 [Lentimicrobium sp.]|jgi:hypothetical protein|nr:hypothetical protein [Lentimicrobium sp.]MDD2528503.1 hypothetical protein [Lentimicrobiaceae bacterium]MDD4598392.1 hypothetical protein [Lentimicrobiaceae bacterium]MDY0026640.1 hypothetical protein [Lentimicrobium sp.]HAH58577.1 hypothetical protein [Bacteroidales bacterium]
MKNFNFLVSYSRKVILLREFKWNPKRKISFPKTFTEAYDSINKGITRENFREFVMPEKD